MSRCTKLIWVRGRQRPCERPAQAVYRLDDIDWPLCAHHNSQAVRAYAARYGVPSVAPVG